MILRTNSVSMMELVSAENQPSFHYTHSLIGSCEYQEATEHAGRVMRGR